MKASIIILISVVIMACTASPAPQQQHQVPDLAMDLMPPREDASHYWGRSDLATMTHGEQPLENLYAENSAESMEDDIEKETKPERVKRSKSGRRLQHNSGKAFQNIFY